MYLLGFTVTVQKDVPKFNLALYLCRHKLNNNIYPVLKRLSEYTNPANFTTSSLIMTLSPSVTEPCGS